MTLMESIAGGAQADGAAAPTGYAVIGDPVAHSLSPAMHNAGYAAAGLGLTYVPHRVPLAAIETEMAVLRERFAGFNVTRPLKEAVASLMDDISPEAAAAGSVNTVTVAAGGRLLGASTDGAGFLGALVHAHVPRIDNAVVLGTGGSARAVAAALMLTGTSVRVLGRNWTAGTRLAVHLRSHRTPASGTVRFVHLRERTSVVLRRVLEDADLLVNTTPLGGPEHPGALPLPDGVVPDPATVVADMVYVPRRTPLLEMAAAEGCTTVEGIEVLVQQGARSFEIWTAHSAPIAAMRDAAHAALARAEVA